MNEELLYEKIYKETQNCGRTQFVKLLQQNQTKITDLQQENEKLKEDMNIKDNIISITFNKDTKEYILDRKNYYKVNKRLNERLDYKSRNEKAIERIKLLGKYDGKYCTRNFKMMSADFNGLLDILQGSDKE